MIWHPDAAVAIRECSGMSQRAVAWSASLGRSYLAQLERGERTNPSAEVIESIADALDVPVAAIAIDPSVDQLIAELVTKLDGDRTEWDVAIDVLTAFKARGRR